MEALGMTRHDVSPSPAVGVTRPLRLAHVMTTPLSLLFFEGQAPYMRAHGLDVEMISSPGPMLDDFGRRRHVPVHALSMARRIAPFADLVSLFRLWRLLRRMRPAIVHAHTPKAGLLGTIAARMAGVPVVMLSVFGLPQMTRTGLMRRLLDFTTRLSCRMADRVWCDSRSMAEYVVAAGLAPAKKVIVLGSGSVNGIDASGTFDPRRYLPETRSALRQTYGIPDTARVLVFVGRITRDKGIGELTEAWRILSRRFDDLHLLVVGPLDEPHGIAAADERTLRKDPRVHLAGMRRDVAEHLAAADLFVNPSYREGFGIANLEASAMELPVVSTRIPGCVDSVQDGTTGTLVPPRDVAALVAAIEAYLNDPNLHRRHAAAGRERALRDFQPHEIWRALEREYRSLAGAPADVAESQAAAGSVDARIAT
jgi:glycosyltransferase involved in cell wall biosynthesis